MQRWCPNCHYFFKDFGSNYCKLANWKLHPIDGGNREVLRWLKIWQDDSTSIKPEANNCPGFLPYPELAQKIWTTNNI